MMTFISPEQLIQFFAWKGVTLSTQDAFDWLAQHQTMELSPLETQLASDSTDDYPPHITCSHKVDVRGSDADRVSLVVAPYPGVAAGIRVDIDVQQGAPRVFVRDLDVPEAIQGHDLSAENPRPIGLSPPVGVSTTVDAGFHIPQSRLDGTFVFKKGHYVCADAGQD